MTENHLVVNEPRIGWLKDENSNALHSAVMLEDTSESIKLTVPLLSFDLLGTANSAYGYESWFTPSGIVVNGVPSKEGKCPKNLMFFDPGGTVVLVDCQTTRTSYRIGGGAGQGQIIANYAVLGGRTLKYGRINGMRTEIEGLLGWFGQSMGTVTRETDDQGRLVKSGFEFNHTDPMPISSSLNLSFVGDWSLRSNLHEGIVSGTESCYVETSVKRGRSWQEHLEAHEAIRDLLVVAMWQQVGFKSLAVYREDDLAALPNGVIMGKWKEVVTHRIARSVKGNISHTALLRYADLGPGGIRRWIKLRQMMPKMIGALVAIQDSNQLYLETLILNTSIALENLGFYLAKKKGTSQYLNKWGQLKTFRIGLELVRGTLPDAVLPDWDLWIDEAIDCYMGTKHSGRQVPDDLVRMNTWRQNVIVLRSWIARYLDLPEQTLLERLRLDALSRPYQAME